jgi:predicted O-methyltransferase YrrM
MSPNRSWNPVLEEVLAVHSGISRDEVRFLEELITELQPRNTVELGLAQGISTLAIADALSHIPGARHIAIDPSENTEVWNGIGLHNLERAGLRHLVDFRDEPSSSVLPKLAQNGTHVDFAFIAGKHTFDHTLAEFFHIDRILRVGGVVVFNDADLAAVRKVLRFMVTNRSYTVYKTLGGRSSESSVDFAIAAPSAVVRGLLTIPWLEEPFSRAIGGDLAGIDKKYGITGSCVALRKNAHDAESRTT